MKSPTILLVALFATSASLSAQQLDFFTSTPLVKALEADGDQVLAQAEIKAAPNKLLVLDKDESGIISDEELGGPGSLPPRESPG